MSEKPLKTVTSINGKLVKRGQDKVSVFDNSLLYADGLFEALMAVDDKPVHLEEHLRRLYRGAKVTGLKVPVSTATLKGWITKTLKAHPARFKKLRLTITGGEAARWTGVQGPPQVVLSVSPNFMPTGPFTLYVSAFRVDHQSIFRRIKTISYVIHAAALRQARAKKCDDALLLNEKDEVAEVSTANIYWVKDGRIYTPGLDSGCLDGVTRRIVMKEARRLKLAITEKSCRLKTLLDADEIFISSSLKLVVSVSRIKTTEGTHRFETGPITQKLLDHFRRQLGLE